MATIGVPMVLFSRLARPLSASRRKRCWRTTRKRILSYLATSYVVLVVAMRCLRWMRVSSLHQADVNQRKLQAMKWIKNANLDAPYLTLVSLLSKNLMITALTTRSTEAGAGSVWRRVDAVSLIDVVDIVANIAEYPVSTLTISS